MNDGPCLILLDRIQKLARANWGAARRFIAQVKPKQV